MLTLENEPNLVWGEEKVMWRQALLDDLANIEREINKVKEAITDHHQKPAYVVEVGGRQKRFQVVPEGGLADPRNGLISADSPLAKALRSSEDGQIIEMSTPRGVSTYTLIKKVSA